MGRAGVGAPLLLRGLQRAQLALGGLRYADVVVGEVERSLSLEQLQRAARALAVHHAVLRTSLRADLDAALLVHPAPPHPLPVELRRGGWEAEVERLLDTPLGGDQPVWRAALVQGEGRSWLLLAVHHALVDGRAMSRLLADLLRALDGPLGPPAPEPVPTPVPALGWRLAAPVLRHLWAWGVRASQARAPLRGPPLPERHSIPTLFAALELPTGSVDRLRDVARTRGATVGGALVAAAWAATRQVGQPGAAWLPVEVMVDLRGGQGVPEVGMFTGGVRALAAMWAPEDPWERAAWATASVRRQMAWGVPLIAHALAESVDDPAAWLRSAGVDLTRNGGAGAVVQVSNTGPWPESWGQLRAVWSATAAVRTGPALLVWLRTVNGVGCLSAIANGVVVPRATLQTWLRAVAQHLQEMSADDR